MIVQELQAGCAAACPKSCGTSIRGYLAAYKAESGYELDEKSYKKLLASCARRCNAECAKGGSAYDYAVSFRRY